MRAIVTGMIATYPVGGVAWDYGQYALGLERLGWEVCYLEDTGGPTYDPRLGYYGEDPAYGVAFLQESLAQLSPSLGERWHFRAMDGTTYGVAEDRFAQISATADLFVNVSGGTLLRDAYMKCPHKILIDTDPGWNHFVNYPRWDEEPGWLGTHGWRAHDHFFTYAERIGQPDCALPELGLAWHGTRPPVIVELWAPRPPGKRWTTVMTWDNFRQPIEHHGITYGTKELEFPKVELLPRRVSSAFELAVGGAEPPVAHWRTLGWSVASSEAISKTVDDYRAYIERSRGEFSVAKNVYVATRSGWFSCRSVCYLAAGRPVVTQDTGFSAVIPTGHGLFGFSNLEEAISAVQSVEAEYRNHQTAAIELAQSCFASDRVLTKMLDIIGAR